METIKSYPWTENLKISSKDFIKWQTEGHGESFTFWSLKNNLIPSNLYFEWAVEYYKIPFLQDMFFEQNLMPKKQWEEIKDLSNWTPEFLPVACWRDIVFVGSVEGTAEKEESFPFKCRHVLVSYQALKLIHGFTSELTKTIKKDEVSPSSLHTSKPSKVKDSPPRSEEETVIAQDQAFSAKTSPGHKHPLGEPFTQQPSIPVFKKATSSDQDHGKTDGPQLKAQDLFPEQEEERLTEVEQATFPGRSPQETNDNLIMGNFQSQAQKDRSSESSAYLENSKTQITTVQVQTPNYDDLWLKTKSLFCSAMLLAVKQDKIYPLSWFGRMQVDQKDEELADLNDHSLFKMVRKGHPYHGFIVDTPAHKKFFNKIGWEKYSEHITAIPIKDEKQELKLVFVGLSMRTFSIEEIKNSERLVSEFFKPHVYQKILKAA